ncbi:acetyltransferase [Mesotoga sp. BH458_6_3_2_1]|nr:acetyltransferase [Mesotoga sp. BH458_6_3_2_1]
MMFECRRISNQKDYLDLMKFSFGIPENWMKVASKHAGEIFSNDLRDPFGAYDGSTLAAEYLLLSLKMRLRDSVIPMGGIGNVCTSPLYRGKGAVKFLLEKSLETMKEKGQAVSLLYPFSRSFYRKLGWEEFDTMLRAKFSPGSIDLPDQKVEVKIEEMEDADGEIREFYNEYASSHYSMILRDEEMWKSDFEFRTDYDVCKKFVKFKREGKTTGMLRYVFLYDNFDKDRGLKFVVTIFLADDVATRHAMFRFLKGLSLQIDQIHAFLPPDFLLWPYLKERPSEMKIVPRTMIRILDLQLLNGLRIDAPDIRVGIKIDDSQASWNDGVFELCVENGELSFSPSDSFDLECDIATLSSVVGGTTDFKEMIEFGRVKVSDGYKGQDLPKSLPFELQHF